MNSCLGRITKRPDRFLPEHLTNHAHGRRWTLTRRPHPATLDPRNNLSLHQPPPYESPEGVQLNRLRSDRYTTETGRLHGARRRVRGGVQTKNPQGTSVPGGLLSVVAGTRFELMTFRL